MVTDRMYDFKRRVVESKTTQHYTRVISHKSFEKYYLLGGLLILLITVCWWASLAAHLQMYNADQFVNAYLFQDSATLKQALIPSTHSFLLKWPIFALLAHIGITPLTLAITTVVITIVTIAALMFIIYKIDKRPLLIGTVSLALASILLMIPAQVTPGALLPLNFAMITTRNIEYIIYIIALFLIIKSTKLKSLPFITSIALLTLLFASDRLFVAFSIIGALGAMIIYAMRKKWSFVTLNANWLLASITAFGLSSVALWFINILHITTIVNQASTSPYPVSHGLKNIILGLMYTVMGTVTNFGANPAYSAFAPNTIISSFFKNIFSSYGAAYVINACLVLFGLILTIRLVLFHIRKLKSKSRVTIDTPFRLATMLIWSSLGACFVFIATSHYYPADARYLTIIIFAVIVSAAVMTRKTVLSSVPVVTFGLVLLFSCCFGMLFSYFNYQKSNTATLGFTVRNQRVNDALQQHAVNTVVGDYWRVLPIKLASQDKQNVLPLGDCLTPRDTLTSTAWNHNLTSHSFGYLLSSDKSQTDYPACNLDQVVAQYGKPNASVVISGNIEKPTESLLIYDHGINTTVSTNSNPPASVVPTTLSALPYTRCEGPTTMNIVAHEDDDLLFMNPDILHDIKAGHCIRTVYVTAGDAGGSSYYWLGREQGSEAAYATMLGINQPVWINRTVKVNTGIYLNVATIKGNPNISLVFMHLPDGNLKGQGFGATKNGSISKLESNQVNTVSTVDNSSAYSRDQLIQTLTKLISTFEPTEIRTQAPVSANQVYPDHSDHMAVGKFATLAHQAYQLQKFNNIVAIPIYYYIGYPIHAMPINVGGDDLAQKMQAFIQYGKTDGGVCHSIEACLGDQAYGAYLPRQYQFNP